jgi:hypothetical protein
MASTLRGCRGRDDGQGSPMSGLADGAVALLRQAASVRSAAVSTALHAASTLAGFRRVHESANLDERDPDFIREHLPGLWLLAALYFRAEVRGLERLPARGPVLLVGNHHGGLVTPDTVMFTLAHNAFFGADRRFHPLAAASVSAMPHPGWLRRFGAIPWHAAEAALDLGAAVLACPERHQDLAAASSRADHVGMSGGKSVLRLAMSRDVLVAPVVSLRWGLGVAGGFLASLPLPVKVLIQVLEPFRIASRFGHNPDVDEVHEVILAHMRSTVDGLAAARVLAVAGR